MVPSGATMNVVGNSNVAKAGGGFSDVTYGEIENGSRATNPAILAGSSSDTSTNSTGALRNFVSREWIEPNSCAQSPHHVAQKFRKTTFPRKSLSSALRPSRPSNVHFRSTLP